MASEQISIGDEAIAQVAMTKMFEAFAGSGLTEEGMADWFLRKASKVRFQPSTRQLVLTFDLAFNTSEPDTSGPVQ